MEIDSINDILSLSKEEAQMLSLFGDIRRDIKSKNRFFLSSKLLNYIDSVAPILTITIPTGTYLWRARRFVEGGLRSTLSDINVKNSKTLQKELSKAFMVEFPGPFWGYDEKLSGAPPANLAVDSRMNPKYISYLYTTKEADTAIYEARVRPFSLVSVAKVEVIHELKVFNVASCSSSDDKILDRFINNMNEEFSMPCDGNLEDYLLCQYLSEYIKSKNYDAIQYYSAMRGYEPYTRIGKGTCVTVFDPKKCRVIESKLHRINSIDITSECVFPYDD